MTISKQDFDNALRKLVSSGYSDIPNEDDHRFSDRFTKQMDPAAEEILLEIYQYDGKENRRHPRRDIYAGGGLAQREGDTGTVCEIHY